MSKIYDKYFGIGDFFDGLSKVMYDIRASRISKEMLVELADELVAKINVDGGLKCFGHPVGASGIRMTYEIYKQLQYKVDNPERQIKNVHRGLSQTFGGPPQIAACMILGNEKG